MSSAYIRGVDRHQVMLLPEQVEDYVSANSVARVIDAFVEGLARGGSESILPAERQTSVAGGRRSYDPAVLLKLLIWGYLKRVRSTRQLEEAARSNLEVIWLLGKLSPDHCSISRFRSSHSKAIARLLKQFNLICSRLELFGAEEVSVDGVLLKAINSKDNNFTQNRLNRRLKKLQAEIETYLQALEQSESESVPTLLPAEIEDLQSKLAQLRQTQAMTLAMQEKALNSPTGQLSLSDPDSRLLSKKKSPGTAVVGYLAQSVVDSKYHLIAAVEVTQQGNEMGQLTPMLKAAREGMHLPDSEASAPAIRALADGGYGDYNDIAQAVNEGFEPWVKVAETTLEATSGLYARSSFEYDAQRDAYRCPEGKYLLRHSDMKRGHATYQTYYHLPSCRQCPVRNLCTTGKYRKIKRHQHQDLIKAMNHRMVENPEVYPRRSASVEHPFGSMMFWNEGRNLLCAGLLKANAEFTLSALAYNLKRALKITGFARMMEALS